MFGRNRNLDKYLFYQYDWHSVQENQRKQMQQSIDSKDGDELLNTPVDDLAKYYTEQFEICVPEILDEDISVDQRETKIDVSQDRNRYINDRSEPFYVVGTSIDVEVPFKGDSEVFKIRPSTFSMNPLQAEILNDTLKFSIVGTNLQTEGVQQKIHKDLEEIRTNLNRLQTDSETFNDSLFELAKVRIETRREKLLCDKSLVAGLGFKMKERKNSSKTYSPPAVRRKVRSHPPKPNTSAYKPEPVLSEEDYKHILEVLDNMAGVMELSPSAFVSMDEESLRSHFLVQLNGHYEGNATGETFNYEGKTDILIKDQGKNIFIAECKFWKGEVAFRETIDQLLGYLSWRDSKSAILIFNRNKDFTSVLENIQTMTQKHANFKKVISKNSETSFSFLFSHKDDQSREMTITVQAYDIPSKSEPKVHFT